MPHLVAAPDKFRGTATAAAVAAAAGRAARESGWSAEEIPLADGGEGSIEAIRRAIGGETRRCTVVGPLGQRVEASWLLVRDTAGSALPPPLVTGDDPVAVIEASQAVGRHLLSDPAGDDPVEATTAGVGELVVEALDAGARQVVVCVGGTATTDGGWGAVSVLGEPAALSSARLVVACDVGTRFRTAARVFGPQKGASASQVALLGDRLGRLEEHYRVELGVDVGAIAGAGAGGGLAGGLAALGSPLVAGFDLVARLVELERRLELADLAMTGEGRFDETSFSGKVVGGVIDALGGQVPALLIAGEVDVDCARAFAARPAPVEVVSLVHLVGRRRAMENVAEAVETAVTESLARLGTSAEPKQRLRFS